MEHDGLTWRDGQFLAKFPNGLTVSVITDVYDPGQGLFEAYVTAPNGDAIVLAESLGLGGDGDGIYGWLTPAKLGLLLTAVAKLRLQEAWL